MLNKGNMSGKVLIVEDEAILAMALEADLTDLGYEVVELVSSGRDALDVLQQEKVDILFLDIKLQGSMNGIETLQKVREIADPFVVVVSGNSEVQTRKRLEEMGVDGFLPKPATAEELKAVLESIAPLPGEALS